MSSSQSSVSDMETTPSRVTRSSPTKNMKKWSKNERKQLNDMLTWCDEMKGYYSKQLELGPGSKQEPPKIPENNLQIKIMGNSRKVNKDTEKTISKKKTKKQMSGEELNNYLKQFIHPNLDLANVQVSNEMLGNNLCDIAKNLNLVYQAIEYKSLESFFKLGALLKFAKTRFDELKIVEKIKLTWQEWIVENTNMSSAYCRRLKRLFGLLIQYPKLQCLKGISCTEICGLQSSIESAFKDPTIAVQWLQIN